MKETWKDIPGYEGLYQASTLGRIKSYSRKGNHGKEHLLQLRIDKGGYLRALITKNKHSKQCLVHRLVATTFIPNPSHFPQINHKDENPSNNNVNNLEWCTAKYNSNYGSRTSRMKETLTNGPCSKKVYQYSLNGNLIRIWPSGRECTRNGYDSRNVSAVCHGRRKTAYGYIWSFGKEGGLTV